MITRNVSGLINEMDMSYLSEEYLSKTKNQEITGELKVGTLNTVETTAVAINKIKMDNLLYTNSSKTQIVDFDVGFKEFGVFGSLSELMPTCYLKKVGN